MGGGPGEAVTDSYVSGENPHISGDSGMERISDLPDNVVKDLSSDQHYGYMITKVIRQSEMDKYLAALAVGKTGHSRLLITANLFCDWWCRDHGLQGSCWKGLKGLSPSLLRSTSPAGSR